MGKKYPYYHCPRRHGCHQPYVLRQKVEEQVASLLERLEIPEPIVKWYIETIENMAGEREQAAQAVGLNRENTKRSVERQLSRLTDLRVRNVIRDQEYLEQREKLLVELAGVERPANVTEVFEPAQAVILALNQAKIRFLAGDDAQKRSIFQSVCSNPTLLDGKLHILAQKPFTLLGERPQILITQNRQDDIRKARLRSLLAYFANITPEKEAQAARIVLLVRGWGVGSEGTGVGGSKVVATPHSNLDL